MLTNKKLRQMYDDFNARYFMGRLPCASTARHASEDMVSLRFVRQRHAGLYTYWSPGGEQVIEVHRDLRHWPNVCALTLLHEMAHAHCQFKGFSADHFAHGSAFEREKMRLLRAGAFTPYL